MDSSVKQTQNEPESAINEAQDAADKRDTPSKKQWRGSKQIYTKLMGQMEFYFSSSNLSKDRFMSKLIQDDPCKYASSENNNIFIDAFSLGPREILKRFFFPKVLIFFFMFQMFH